MTEGTKSSFESTPYEWELISEPPVYGKALVLTFLDIASLKLESGMKRVISVGSLLITRHTGQENSLNLWALIGKLIWRGFGTQKNEYYVSRLMAFDAEIIGTGGCLPHMSIEGSGINERRKQKLCLYSSLESSVSKALYFLEVSWL